MRTKNLEMLNVHRQYVADYLRQDHYHCWQASLKWERTQKCKPRRSWSKSCLKVFLNPENVLSMKSSLH